MLEQPSGADASAIAILERELQRDRARGERPRVEIAGLGGAWQNLAMVRGWAAINGYNPLRIGDYDRLVSPGEGNWRADMRKFPVSFRSYDCALARALGLKYLVLGRPIGKMPHPQAAVVADTLLDGPKIWIYRLNNPMPRLKFVSRVQIADGNSAVRQAQYDYAQDRVLLDNAATRFRSLGPRLARDNAGRVKIIAWEPGRIVIEAESEAGGVLSMHATSYPGWVAEIDGQEVPVLRADHLFRAVEVPAGSRRIIFTYRPLSLANLKLAAGDGAAVGGRHLPGQAPRLAKRRRPAMATASNSECSCTPALSPRRGRRRASSCLHASVTVPFGRASAYFHPDSHANSGKEPPPCTSPCPPVRCLATTRHADARRRGARGRRLRRVRLQLVRSAGRIPVRLHAGRRHPRTGRTRHCRCRSR